MYATKRKFHNLLQSVTGPYASTTSSDLEKEPTTIREKLEARVKRQRLEAISTRDKRSSTVATTGLNQLPRTTTVVELKPAPNFAPWDRSKFLGRLKTFRHVDKWTAKPRAVDEVQWAKRGWVCVGPERVKCLGGCGRELVVKLERKDADQTEQTEDSEEKDSQTEQALISRYQKLVIDAHEDTCLWKRRGIYHLPLASQATCIPALLERYTGLERLAKDIPSNISTPSIEEDLVESIYKLLLQPKQETLSLSPQALKLALFGWEVEPGHVQGLLSCQACFRRLGLWLFKAPADGDEVLMQRLDVIQEHREYCPWVDANSQGGGAKSSRGNANLPGWQVSLRTLRNAITSLDPDAVRPDTGSTDQKSSFDEFGSVSGSPEAQSARAAKDEERWSRLKKMRRMFDSKSSKPRKEK